MSSELGILLQELACWVKNDQREMVMLVSEGLLTEKQVLAALCWAVMWDWDLQPELFSFFCLHKRIPFSAIYDFVIFQI